MKRAGHILTIIIFMLLAVPVSAQFSMNTVDESSRLELPAMIYHTPIEVDVMNAAKARATRKALWRQHNLVDLKVSFTGTATQFNKSWATNNQNSVSGLIVGYYYHTYTKNRFTSQFKFDGQYGMNLIEDIWFKNQDQLKLYTLASWKVKDKGVGRFWAYSFSALFTTQFSEGYKSRTEKHIVWSNFMAPATLDGGLGLTYTSPNKKLPFIVTMEPISGKVLFVMDGRILPDRRQKLGIPVTYAADDTSKEHPIYKNYKAEGGSTLTVSFDRTFKFGPKKGMSLRYRTVMKSFYGWITEVSKNDPGSIKPAIMPTLNWTNTINFDPLKFLTLQFTHTTVYDKSQVDKVQMQYFLSVGLTYGYKNK